MPTFIRALVLLCLPLAACQSNARLGAAPTTQPGVRPPASQPTTRPADGKEDAKQARERERKLRRAEQGLEVAQLNLAKAKIAMDLDELRYQDALKTADREFELAKRKLQIFTKFETPNRLARAALSLQQTEDGHLESQQELAQLELLYKGEQFADDTKEIVIERARRHLERAARDLELRREEVQRLQDVTLPLEQTELEHAAEQKRLACLNVQRDHEGPLIDRKVAVLTAQAEVTKLEEEITDLHEEIAKAAAEVRTRPTSDTK
jgi:hypothetical protein